MRKALLLLVATAVLWVPAVSVAGDSSQSHDAKSDVSTPVGTCQSRRSELNSANAFGKCVSETARHKDKSDDKDDAKSHDEDSGESDDKDSEQSHGKEGANPAVACKAMRAKDLAHFQTTYGTRPNAYGKCVSEHAHGKNG